MHAFAMNDNGEEEQRRDDDGLDDVNTKPLSLTLF
jgi:hypothetical protein